MRKKLPSLGPSLQGQPPLALASVVKGQAGYFLIPFEIEPAEPVCLVHVRSGKGAAMVAPQQGEIPYLGVGRALQGLR